MSAKNINKSAVSLYSVLVRKFAGRLSAEDCQVIASDYYAGLSVRDDASNNIRELIAAIEGDLADGVNPADIIRLEQGEFTDDMVIGDDDESDDDSNDMSAFASASAPVAAPSATETLVEAMRERSAFPPVEAPEVPQTKANAQETVSLAPYVRQYPYAVLELCRESVFTRDASAVPCAHRLTDTVIVGSDPSRADVVLERSRSMGRAHAKLYRQGDCWVIEPLQDLHPTYIGRRILSLGTRAHIKHGDHIQLGDHHYYARLVASPYTERGQRCDHPTLAELVGNNSTKTASNGNGKANPIDNRPVVVVCPDTTVPVLQTTIRREIVSSKTVLYGACADLVQTALGIMRRCDHSPDENSEFALIMRNLESARETLVAKSKIDPVPAPVATPVVASAPTVSAPVVAPVVQTPVKTAPVVKASEPSAPKQVPAQAPTTPALAVQPKAPVKGESVRVNGFTISSTIPDDKKLGACGMPVLMAHARHHDITEYTDKQDIIRQLGAKRDSVVTAVPVVLDKPTVSAPSAPVREPVKASESVKTNPVAPSAPQTTAQKLAALGVTVTIDRSAFGRPAYVAIRNGNQLAKALDANDLLGMVEVALGIRTIGSAAKTAPTTTPVAPVAPIASAPTVPVTGFTKTGFVPSAPQTPALPATPVKASKTDSAVNLDIPTVYREFVSWMAKNAEAREILIDRFGIRAEFEAITGKGSHMPRAALLWSAIQSSKTDSSSNGSAPQTNAKTAPKQEGKANESKTDKASKSKSKIEGKDSASRLGITTGAFRVLSVLAQHEGMPLTYARIVLKCEKVTQGNMPSIKEELLSRGWISEEIDSSEGKDRIVLSIEEDGIEALASVME